ncbi:MAG: tetratricopeptide repeat protein [Planctomycetes bacterium]|nr:tetratricopeptide repeat protein [Planctomycetota bacterium]
MFKDESEFKKIIDRLNIDTDPNQKHHDDLRRQMLNVFNETKQQSQKPATPHGVLRRIIMKSPITKLAAAAAIIIAILIGLPFLSPNSSSVVLADVLERIEQTQAFMYRMTMTTTGAMMSDMPTRKIEIQGTTIISTEYGMKMEMATTDPDSGAEEVTQQMYIIPDQKLMISLMPKHKKYMRMEFDDDLLARQKKQNNDPREMIKQIMDCEYTELGRSVIDGIDVEGFHTTDPAYYGGAMENIELTLWVDVEKWLPVRAEMDFKMNEQMRMQGVIYDFQWDIPVVASDFEPVIPDDYTAFSTEAMKMPSMTEEAALEGLKFFAEIVGQYPKKLNLMNLMQEFSAIKDSENLTDAGMKLKEEMDRAQKDEHMKKVTETMLKVQSIGMFYMMLIQDKKEPVYYGETVTLQDVEKVLLRWKISDNQYRVIFGDLSALDVSADELTDLEKSMIDDGYKMPSITEEAALGRRVKSPADDYYERGETHYLDGEYDQAFSELTKAIEIDPALARAYITRGMVYANKGEHDLAIADFTKAIEIGPGLARAYVTRGQAYNDKNEFDLAIADFTRFIEIKPTDAHAYLYRGMAYKNKGEYDLAVTDYSKAIEIDPKIADAYSGRAGAYYYKGEYDKAWKDVYKAQALGRKVDSKLLEKLRKASGRDG